MEILIKMKEGINFNFGEIPPENPPDLEHPICCSLPFPFEPPYIWLFAVPSVNLRVFSPSMRRRACSKVQISEKTMGEGNWELMERKWP
jgi:hypothetical protein